jgi:hypothetical protein
MVEGKIKPDYVFETSWEVCNKVGGIYTVLSSKARTMTSLYKDNVIFIGPDTGGKKNPWFKEDNELLKDWKEYAVNNDNLNLKIGRWDVPGNPVTILISFDQYFSQKNKIYGEMWDKFGVDSLQAYGDYDESCMFAYGTGAVIESFYKYHKLDNKHVIAHFNEWMLGMGLLYIKTRLPQVGTVFTTHATSIGRSIAGNGKPLYNYLSSYDGDQMARELNMEAKHSIEKKAAQNADCFTTVSEITARECKQLLQREPLVTPNGFEKDFIPVGEKFEEKRQEARKKLINITEKLVGYDIDSDALLIATSGRYEYKNKGLDVFIEAMGKLNHVKQLNKDILAFILVPAWAKGPRADLQNRMKVNPSETISPLNRPYITHWLHDLQHDPIVTQINYLNMQNKKEDKVKIIFVPSYLTGDDGIFNMSYYDLLIGMDLTVFASYYEPWGYTPHESIAFSVPTITTTLSGFGMWMKRLGDARGMDDGAEVIRRDDYNNAEVSEDICNFVFEMTTKSVEQENILRQAAMDRAALADWSHFFTYYEDAYKIALTQSNNRKANK